MNDKVIADKTASCWHRGELTIQRRAGTEQQMATIGPRFIREFMPAQHRDFFQSLTMLFIAHPDQHANSVANLLFGDPGFIVVTSETELLINTQYSLGDMFSNDFNIGDRIGLLGIEFATKRRNRVNAVITEIKQKSIRVQVLQSYGNCAQYIQEAPRGVGTISAPLQIHYGRRISGHQCCPIFVAEAACAKP